MQKQNTITSKEKSIRTTSSKKNFSNNIRRSKKQNKSWNSRKKTKNVIAIHDFRNASINTLTKLKILYNFNFEIFVHEKLDVQKAIIDIYPFVKDDISIFIESVFFNEKTEPIDFLAWMLQCYQEIYPEKFDWDCKLERFDASKYDGANIIISCVDNVKTRIDIDNHFIKQNSSEYKKNLYWLDFGNGKDFGQFVLGSNKINQPKSDFSTVNKLKTVLELFPDMINHEDINEPSCSTREALMHQDLFINSILVSTGMNLLWKLFTEYKISYHGGFVNLKNMNLKPMNL